MRLGGSVEFEWLLLYLKTVESIKIATEKLNGIRPFGDVVGSLEENGAREDGLLVADGGKGDFAGGGD